MEEMAALLSCSATKQRLAGVTGLLEQLRRQNVVDEASTTIFPRVLPCLRDNNSKITLNALEILELLVTRVTESTLRSYLKPLWTSLVERLGDNKMLVREKAVDVVVEISLVLDVSTVLEKLQQCMKLKNWRAREQSLHAIWRILEKHKLFKERQSELVDDVLKLLGDSSKDVRDAAMTTLVKFYTYIGPSFLINLQDKKIRPGQMMTLKERCEQSLYPDENSAKASNTVSSHDVASTYCGVATPSSSLPDALASLFSSYDMQASSSSPLSVSRYLESVQKRTLSEATDTAAASANEIRTFSQETSSSSKVKHEFSLYGPSSDDISDKEIQQQLGIIDDKLEPENNWDKRVDGLKMLQNLANRCAKASNNSSAIASLSHNLRPIRERLCQQVCDLRSTVSREACETIQTLAQSLRDEFNTHAEVCLGNLLKATYVTIQVISTAANATIRSIIESTSDGFVRVIPKFIECAKSRNHVLRYNAVCYLTLTLQRWSVSFLSKHSDMFVPILPAILRDALADVRAQARKCYWSFYYLFPNEAESVFTVLDASTQKNLKDDPSKFTSKAARPLEYRSPENPLPQKSEITRSGLRTINSNTSQPPLRAPVASNPTTSSDEKPNIMSGEVATGKLPRRVWEKSSSALDVDATVESTKSSRILGALRVGLAPVSKSSVAEESSVSTTDNKKSTVTGPVRVQTAAKSVPTTNAGVESLYTSRQEPSTAGFHRSLNPAFKAQRVQEPQHTTPPGSSDTKVTGPKRLPIASVPSPATSNASNSRANASSKAESGDKKLKRLEQVKVVGAPAADQLEVALQSIESKFWSTRLEGAEYLGNFLQKRADQINESSRGDYAMDGRILLAFIKHLSDAHYRVSQCVLQNFLPLLKLLNDNRILLPHLKTIFPKLFQKFIETKEAVRAMAKETLEHIASTIDSATLSAIVISMLGDGSNMKVKAAMCSYLRSLLPGAQDYITSGANYSHMRAFLLKVALLMDADAPVSVSSACGELISTAAQLYGPEMDKALALLPPSKRLIVAKVLKSNKIVLNSNNLHKPSVSSTASNESRSREESDNNQTIQRPVSKQEKSRKRPESPSSNSSSSARQNTQKRINTTSQPVIDDQSLDLRVTNPTDAQANAGVVKEVLPGYGLVPSAVLSVDGTSVDKHSVLELEDILHHLEQTNVSEAEMKHTLYKTSHFIETGSTETWDRCFDRLLVLLLDIATGQNVLAMKVLQKLVIAQRSRAQRFFELLLGRLVNTMADQSGESRHLAEGILHDLVRSSRDYEQTLSTLVPLILSREPPTLPVVLRLVTICFQQCERNSLNEVTFLRHHDVADGILSALSQCLSHTCSNVRKGAVDCFVALHFAVMEDNAVVPKYLAEKVDKNQRRLVEIFIDRAQIERHHVKSS